MKAFAIALVAATTSANSAPPQPYRPQMSGHQLVSDMLADPAQAHINSIRRERAMGYISGVMDASAGSRWCSSGKQLPHELNYVVIEEIAKVGPEKLKGDAASLILSMLARMYPCPGAKS